MIQVTQCLLGHTFDLLNRGQNNFYGDYFVKLRMFALKCSNNYTF